MVAFKKIGKNISDFESGYSRSYFSLFLIYAVACDVRKYKPSQIYKQFKVDRSKDRLETKVLSWFSKLPNGNLSLVLLSSLKNLTWHASAVGRCFRCTCEWSLLCSSRNKSFLEILPSDEYKKCWFLELKTRFTRFETRFIRGSSIVLVLSRHPTLLKPSRLI